MNARLSLFAAAAAAVVCTGCGASLQPLKTAEAPRSISSVQALPQKIPVPIALQIQAPDNPPTIDGKYVYPLKQYLQKAFKDAMGGAFAEGEPGGYAYTLDVQAFSSQLETWGKHSKFSAKFNSVLRGPDNKVLENVNFQSEIESPFDKKQVPDSVWTVAYKASNDLLASIRKARWLKIALKDSPVAAGGAVNMQDVVRQAAMKVMESQKPAGGEAAQIDSDVDTPKYQVKENPDNYAIIIGIEKYQNIPDAPYAEHDAAAVKQHLLALGYPERNIIFLTGNQAERSSIVKYIESWLPRNLNENSKLFFYYSGHGSPDVETSLAYLLPWEADPQFLESTAYPIKRLYEKLNALPAKQIIVAMDSCFSGAGGRSVIAKGTRPLVSKVDTGTPMGKLVVFAASNGDEITGAKNDQGHGLFTYYFLKGLNGEAQDKKGAITSKDLYDYLVPHVKDAARRENRGQTPQLLGGDQANTLVLRDAQ